MTYSQVRTYLQTEQERVAHERTRVVFEVFRKLHVSFVQLEKFVILVKLDKQKLVEMYYFKSNLNILKTCR